MAILWRRHAGRFKCRKHPERVAALYMQDGAWENPMCHECTRDFLRLVAAKFTDAALADFVRQMSEVRA